MRKSYTLDLTTQGPLYPPSEVMDEHGNFIVIGAINKTGPDGKVETSWGNAIVANNSAVPSFGDVAPYRIIEEFSSDLPQHLKERVLHTLPLPLPCSNYPMLFAPQQYPEANSEIRRSYPFHETPIPDFEESQGRKLLNPITLDHWMTAVGELVVSTTNDDFGATFEFEFSDLIPNSLYTIMSLRQKDLDPSGPTRPSPLGVPNVFTTDENGNGAYKVVMPNPFPSENEPNANRIINIVVLWMSYQLSHGGAIGRYGLGGDIHAHLKLRAPSFHEFTTNA